MSAKQFISLCLVAASAFAAPAVHTGVACPYASLDHCNQNQRSGDDCTNVVFGQCIGSPTVFDKFKNILFYNPETNIISYQRYIDHICFRKDMSWSSHPVPSGQPGECIGPIANEDNINFYIHVTVNGHQPAAKTEDGQECDDSIEPFAV